MQQLNGDPTIHAGAPELCDGFDNNCNGIKDEGCTIPIFSEGLKPVNMGKPLAKAAGPALEVTLWPNPARNVLIVSLNAFEAAKKLVMVLMQADGRAVVAQNLLPAVKEQQVRFDMRAMGVKYYLFQLKQGSLTVKKQVIMLR